MLSLFTILRRTPRQTGLKPGEVLMTFDDGPNLEDNVTPEVLDVLHQHSVKAGFCVVGKQVKRHPRIVQRMHYSGHLLINHTQNHVHPIRQNYGTLVEEVETCDREIGRALGIVDYKSEYFRAPFGIVTLAVRRVTRNLNLKPVLLSHYGWDTRVTPEDSGSVVQMMIDNARLHNGGMFVFHDGNLCPPSAAEVDWSQSVENRSWVPAAVDHVITVLKDEGLQFVLPESQDPEPLINVRAVA